jgi:hypothetical protein
VKNDPLHGGIELTVILQTDRLEKVLFHRARLGGGALSFVLEYFFYKTKQT